MQDRLAVVIIVEMVVDDILASGYLPHSLILQHQLFNIHTNEQHSTTNREIAEV